mgnify:CR=1 FL=1
MKITIKHPFTGKDNTLDLDVTQEELDNWVAGELIQSACPRLTADEREFLISGLIPGEFDKLFPDEEEYQEGKHDTRYDDHIPDA